jgi:hypothetical protein
MYTITRAYREGGIPRARLSAAPMDLAPACTPGTTLSNRQVLSPGDRGGLDLRRRQLRIDRQRAGEPWLGRQSATVDVMT